MLVLRRRSTPTGRKFVEITIRHVGDRRILEIAPRPVTDRVPIARLVRHRLAAVPAPRARDGDEADHVLASAIDRNRHWPSVNDIDAAADEGEARVPEVDNQRGKGELSVEPWLHGMAIARCDVEGRGG